MPAYLAVEHFDVVEHIRGRRRPGRVGPAPNPETQSRIFITFRFLATTESTNTSIKNWARHTPAWRTYARQVELNMIITDLSSTHTNR